LLNLSIHTRLPEGHHELDIRQAEVRSFLRGTLSLGRTEEIHKQLLAKGIPA